MDSRVAWEKKKTCNTVCEAIIYDIIYFCRFSRLVGGNIKSAGQSLHLLPGIIAHLIQIALVPLEPRPDSAAADNAGDRRTCIRSLSSRHIDLFRRVDWRLRGNGSHRRRAVWIDCYQCMEQQSRSRPMRIGWICRRGCRCGIRVRSRAR